MEIRPSSAGYFRELAEVTFENFEERYQFGLRIPLFRSRESWRHVSYICHPLGLPNYAEEKYPRTVTVPYNVLGQAAAGLAGVEVETGASEGGRIDKNMQRTIINFLQNPDQAESFEVATS